MLLKLSDSTVSLWTELREVGSFFGFFFSDRFLNSFNPEWAKQAGGNAGPRR